MYKPTYVVGSEKRICRVIPAAFVRQLHKFTDYIDHHVRIWIKRSPLISVATYSSSGTSDISPKADPAGFVKVLDEKTLALPDQPGNHRFHGFLHILETGRIVLMFPGLRPIERQSLNMTVAASAIAERKSFGHLL